MIRTAAMPQKLFIALFLFLAAVVLAVAPVPLLFRSLGVVLCSYLAFAAAGMPAAYLTALLAPPLGLIRGDLDWLVMMPIIISGNLLAMLGLEFTWRALAIAVSPVLLVMPALVTWQLSDQALFEVTLPWDGQEPTWVLLHLLVAAAGVLVALYLDRQRSRAA
jgi:hypothetical protein